jgi:hypothetical protein
MAKVSKTLKALLRQRGLPSQKKAKKMLKDGEVRGKALSKKQKGLLGLIASGKLPQKLADVPKSQRAKVQAPSA